MGAGAFKSLNLFWVAMFVSNVVIMCLAFVIVPMPESGGAPQSAPYVFMAVGLVLLIISHLIPVSIFRKRVKQYPHFVKNKNSEALFQMYLTPQVIMLAYCEAVTAMGIAACVQTHDPRTILPFGIAAVANMVLLRPSKDKILNLAEKAVAI